MCDFDLCLKDALIDANLLDFQRIIMEADTLEIDFSSHYCEERMRMLEDPFAWAKQWRHSTWKRMARNIACIFLVCTIIFGMLTIVSPTVHAAVLRWFREIVGSEVIYRFNGSSGLDTTSFWRPTWLPEGWVMTGVQSRDANTWWRLENDDMTATLDCASFCPNYNYIGTDITNANAEFAYSTITIQGHQADYYEGNSNSLLVWEDGKGNLFWMRTSFWADQLVLEKIAESMTPYLGTAESYEMEWIPEGYESFDYHATGGAVQAEWIKDGNILTWQYVTDPFCPWKLPERTPELVIINGLQARYWAGKSPEDENTNNSIIVNGELMSKGEEINLGGVSIITGTAHGIEESSVLIWTDPETHTDFLLKGVLNREDLLHMAESVIKKSSSQK